MENEKTSSPRRVRDDETQVLEEADLVEIEPAGADAVDRGWSTGDERARREREPTTVNRAAPDSASARNGGAAEAASRPHEAGEKAASDATSRKDGPDPASRKEAPQATASRKEAPIETAPAAPAYVPLFDLPQRSPPSNGATPVAAPAIGAQAAAAKVDVEPRADRSDTEIASAIADDARWQREADALAGAQPTRAALLLSFRARAALDLAGDAVAAQEALDRAASLAPDARFVALTRRWIAEHGGDAAAVAAAARAEIPLAGDALERALLHWQVAGIEQHAAGRPDAAVRELREAVALDPQDLGAHLALAAIAVQQGRWRDAAEAWETTASRTDDRVARAALHTASASARECFLDDPAGARAALERALEADPDGAATRAALESLHLRAQAWPEYARMLVLDAERAGDLDPGLGYHERAGDVLWECLADGPAAATCYRRAAELVPGDVVPLGKLAALYEQEGRYEELVAVYEQLAVHLPDPTRRAGVLLRLGTLYEGRLDRPDDALRSYQKALEAAPTLAAAAQALAAHYQARGRWSELTSLLLVEADRLTAPAQRAARYAAIAEQRESHLGIGDEVVALHERALALDPGQAAALDALDRIYRARERWQPLVALHEQQLAHARDPGRVRALRLTLAALYQERLAAPERAAAHLTAVLAVPAVASPAPDFSALVALARALAEAGQWPEHVDALERQAAALSDEADAVATLYRVATVIETRLHDPRRALAAYQRVLERAPGHAQALDSILRLQRSQSRWEELIAAERRLLAATERAEEAAAILYRIGQVAEEHLGRADDAIAAYGEAIERLPTYRLARVGLERLLRARGRFDRLADLLEQQASGDTSAAGPREREAPRDDATADAGGTRKGQAADPRKRDATADAEVARKGQAASDERKGDPTADAGVTRADDPRKDAAHRKAGGDALDRARVLCQAATVRELHAAQRGAAGRDGVDGTADPEPAVRAVPAGRDRAATTAVDPAAARAAAPGRDRAAPTAVAAPDLAAARALHERALALCPGFAPALWGLCRIGERSGDWAAAASALEELAGRAEEPSVRARLLLRLARITELRLGRPELAAELYDRALELQPDPAAIFDRLRVALAGESADGAAVWLERAADATGDPRLAAALLRLRAAAIEHARPAGAESDGDGQPPADGRRAAAAAYEAALGRANDPRALEGLARNLAAGGRDGRLPAALTGRARLVRDAPTRGLLLCAAGALYERADSAADAEAAYAEALAAIPDFLPALAGRRRLAEAEGNWAAAAALCADMGALARDPQNKVELYEEAAALSLDRLGDLGAAVQHYRAVLAAQPGHRGALDRTLEVLEQTGDWSEAVAVLSELVEAIGDDGARADLLGLRARILAERLGDAHAAIVDIERASRLRPDTSDLLRLLAELHESTGHWADAALAFERLATAAPDPATARDARLAQARIWTESVPDYPRAQRLLEEVVVRDPDDRAALIRLAEVALRAGDGRRAAVVHQHLAESGEPEDRVRSLLALADLQSEIGDSAASDAAAAAALDLTADTPDLIAVLEGHYRSRGELERHAALAEEALRRMPLRAPGALPLRLALARVLGRELGAKEQALEHLHQATRGHPKAALPRVALAEALADDEPDAAIAELRRIIEVQPTEAAAYAGLAAVCRSRGWVAPATLMTTAAALLGGDQVPDQLERELSSPLRPTPGSLPPEDALRFLVGASQATPVREILEQIDPYLPAIFPDGQELVGMLEPLPGLEPAAALARSIAHALAVGSVDIYRGDSGDPLLLMSEPRALVLDPHHLGSAGRTSFDAASALSRLAAGSAVGQVLEPDRVQALLRVATDPAGDPANRDLRKRLTSAIPRRARKDLERTAADVGVIDQRRWAVWEQEERRRARRAGIVFSRDLRAAAVSILPDAVTAPIERRLALIAASEPMLDALRFAASDTCWSLCRRIFRG